MAGQRRPKGSGSVYQLPSGRWACKYTAWDTTAGKQMRRRFTADDRLEVEQHLAQNIAGGRRPVVAMKRQGHQRKAASLYRYFAADGRLLYVGITSTGALRQLQHSQVAEWWPDVALCRIEHFRSRAEAVLAEAHAIASEGPIYNRAGKPALLAANR